MVQQAERQAGLGRGGGNEGQEPKPVRAVFDQTTPPPPNILHCIQRTQHATIVSSLHQYDDVAFQNNPIAELIICT